MKSPSQKRTIIILVIISFIVFLIAKDIFNLYFSTSKKGVLATGRVLKKDFFATDDSLDKYQIEYTFEVITPNRTKRNYTAKRSVSKEYYDILKIGHPVIIKYNPNNPNNSHIDGDKNYKNTSLFWRVIIASVLFLFVIGLIFNKYIMVYINKRPSN